ncbi:MAG: cystathionine gamma-synthase [Moraxellaceae bacterium]|jgi:cytochrome c-type biogenesis protein CcmH|nr:cystathionine gamma-synthase [Moraxellaceae bacterium]
MMKTLWLLLALFAAPALAAIDVHEFDSPEQEQRYRQLVNELRCPKCQNQNLSGSDAPVAKDLRDRTYVLLQAGKSDAEIRTYMVERYGDFITYRPPLRTGTLLLWAGPFVLLLAVAAILVWRVRRPAAAPAPLSDEERRRLAQLLDDPKPKN